MVIIPNASALLFNLPIIITLIAAVRYIVGFKTWKNYPTLILALSLYFFYEATQSPISSIMYWVLYVAIMVASAIGTRLLLRKQKINYYSRIAMLYLGATIGALILTGIISLLQNTSILSQTNFALAIALIGTTIEEFATLQFKKDTQEFIRRLGTTLVLALISGLIVIWPWWNAVLLRHQEILVIVLLADVIISSWTALRVTELIRFNSITRNQK